MVPGLIVGDSAQVTEEPSYPLPGGVEVCHDARGDLLAYCHTLNGAICVDMPEVASFSYEPGTANVRAIPRRPLAPGFILETFHHCVLPLILPALGTEVLHASAVIGADGVTALCGTSGTGKSTIAVALARRGYPLWADDAVAVDTAAPGPKAIPLSFAIRLRQDAAGLLEAAGEVPRSAVVAPLDTEPRPLATLCMLRRNPDATASVAVERLEPAAALRSAVAHAYCFSVKDPARKRRTISSYLAITARVPVYEICFRPGAGHLGAVLDAIEATISRTGQR